MEGIVMSQFLALAGYEEMSAFLFLCFNSISFQGWPYCVDAILYLFLLYYKKREIPQSRILLCLCYPPILSNLIQDLAGEGHP
jgi:hypothetical protein